MIRTKQQKALFTLIQLNSHAKTKKIAETMDITLQFAGRLMNQLKDRGFVKKERRTNIRTKFAEKGVPPTEIIWHIDDNGKYRMRKMFKEELESGDIEL